MSNKATITGIKKLIREARMEQAYENKFVKNFTDVRKPQLTEAELDLLAQILFEETFYKK